MGNLSTAIRGSLLNRGDDWVVRFLTSRCDAVEEEISGRTLHVAASSMAAALVDRGLTGQRVVLAMPTSVDFDVALIGCLYAGVTVVPSPVPRPSESVSRLEGIIRDSGARAILCDTESLGALHRYFDGLAADAPPELIDVTALERPEEVGALPGFQATSDEVVVIQYTSGSTREPHGVVVTHGGSIANADTVRRLWHLAEETVLLSWMPNYHDMGLFGGIIHPLTNGSRTVHIPTLSVVRSPVRWLRAVAHQRVTISGAPPFAFAMCLDRVSDAEAEGLDLSSWEVAFCAADTVPADLLVRFRDRFEPYGLERAAVFACYGLAEATLFAAGERRWDGSPPPADHPGVEGVAPCLLSSVTDDHVCVVDAVAGRPCGEGEEGEVWIAGPHLGAGYLGRPDVTREVFGNALPGSDASWLRTGDVGVIEDGALYITGRTKDILICNGMNVAAHDIEWLAATHHAELNGLAAAAFHEDPMGGDAAVLLIETRSSRSFVEDPDALKGRIRASVGRTFGVDLRRIAFVQRGSLERTSSGKVRRRSVAERYRRGDDLNEVGQP